MTFSWFGKKKSSAPKSSKGETHVEKQECSPVDADAVSERKKPKPTWKQQQKPMTRNELVALEWHDCFKHRDRARLEKVTDLSSRFTMKDPVQGDMEFRVQDIYDVCFNFWQAFPDCDFSYEEIKETSANTVVIKSFCWCGHHTGVPYKYDPYPPIEPKGTYVKDGPIDMTFTLDSNGIIIDTVSTGNNSGPHGTYEKLGGIIIS